MGQLCEEKHRKNDREKIFSVYFSFGTQRLLTFFPFSSKTFFSYKRSCLVSSVCFLSSHFFDRLRFIVVVVIIVIVVKLIPSFMVLLLSSCVPCSVNGICKKVDLTGYKYILNEKRSTRHTPYLNMYTMYKNYTPDKKNVGKEVGFFLAK